MSRLLEKLADDNPVVKEKGKAEPEVTILKRNDADGGEDSLKENKPDGKEVVQSLFERIPEHILKRTRVGKKKVAFKEEAEQLGPQRKMLMKSKCQGSGKSGTKTQRRAAMMKIVYA